MTNEQSLVERHHLRDLFAADARPFESDPRTVAERACIRASTTASGLDHRQLPSCWASAVIHAARVRAVLVGRANPAGRKTVSQLDLLHLDESAAYADVFITSDRRLRAFAHSAKTLLHLRCEVLSVEDWVTRLTG